jgi:hypothetical protein
MEETIDADIDPNDTEFFDYIEQDITRCIERIFWSWKKIPKRGSEIGIWILQTN